MSKAWVYGARAQCLVARRFRGNCDTSSIRLGRRLNPNYRTRWSAGGPFRVGQQRSINGLCTATQTGPYVRNCSDAFGARLWRRDRHMLYEGQCHCGAICVELTTDRPPGDQVLGACQCSFCRKHNARAFSDPKAHVTLTAADPQHIQRYSFGLKTSDQIICRRCGVYVAMTLTDGDQVWSVINIDTLDDRALFNRAPEARDYNAEDREGRIARRKARWCPTTLVGWPASASG